MEKKYDNTNRGTLGKNETKQDPSHADYNGKINVQGTEYWLNGWIKKSQDGRTFLSLQVKEKNKQPDRQSSEPTRRGGSGFDDMSNDIPF